MLFRNTGLALAVALALPGAFALAQESPKNPTKRVGKYAVELRIPAEGLYAEEESDIEFRVTDASQDDPVQGAPPVVKARVAARITMPAMPAMPAQAPKTHSEGVPGDYGVITYFPHGGEYQLDLTVTPPDDKAFTASFKLLAKDAATGVKRPIRPKPYTLEIKSDPPTPRAGEPTTLTILLRSRETKQPVMDFETVHEQKMHLIIVSKDLSRFAHEHPDLSADGTFRLRYTFPTGGEYRLFADSAPRGAGSQVLMQPLTVAGPSPQGGALQPSRTMEPTGGVQLALKTKAEALATGRALNLTFTVQEAASGSPVTDLQPWLGAMAHLILIHQDGATFVHSHPDETDPKNGKQGSLTFLARFPKPGTYRGWVQFQRGGQVYTAPFTVVARAGESQ